MKMNAEANSHCETFVNNFQNFEVVNQIKSV